MGRPQGVPRHRIPLVGRALNYYPHFLGDYARDTAGLSMLEHGAYRLLLDTVYATEQPLPAESDEIYRIAKANTRQERAAVDRIVEKFFPIGPDGKRHNARADVEIEQWKKKSKKASSSARERWHSERSADAMRTHSVGNATQNQNQHQNQKEGGVVDVDLSQKPLKPIEKSGDQNRDVRSIVASTAAHLTRRKFA